MLRERLQIIRISTTNILSMQNLFARNTGKSIRGNEVNRIEVEDVALLLEQEEHALAMSCNLSVLQQCQAQI